MANERFHCEHIGVTVTQYICSLRVERRDPDCAGVGCPKIAGAAEIFHGSGEVVQPGSLPVGVLTAYKKYGEKTCAGYDTVAGRHIDCGLAFVASHGHQQRCPACNQKQQSEWVKKSKARAAGKPVGAILCDRPVLKTTEVTEMESGEKKKSKHHKCSIAECTKFAVRNGMCISHDNEARGIVKKRGGANPRKNPGPATGTLPPAAVLLTDYSLVVNFSDYPKLHERLTTLATQEYRTPEMQLLYLLNQELAQLEAQAQ